MFTATVGLPRTLPPSLPIALTPLRRYLAAHPLLIQPSRFAVYGGKGVPQNRLQKHNVLFPARRMVTTGNLRSSREAAGSVRTRREQTWGPSRGAVGGGRRKQNFHQMQHPRLFPFPLPDLCAPHRKTKWKNQLFRTTPLCRAEAAVKAGVCPRFCLSANGGIRADNVRQRGGANILCRSWIQLCPESFGLCPGWEKDSPESRIDILT